MKSISTNPLIASVTLWLGEGKDAIRADMSMHQIAPNSFEVYVSKGGEVPSRYWGTLGEMFNVSQAWHDARKAEGFVETIESRSAPVN